MHSDDLAVSVDIDAPALPEPVLGPVLALLVGVSLRRHGQAAVVRALSRRERAGVRLRVLRPRLRCVSGRLARRLAGARQVLACRSATTETSTIASSIASMLLRTNANLAEEVAEQRHAAGPQHAPPTAL